MMTMNRQWRLASRPRGFPQESDFELAEVPIPEPAEGQTVVRALWLSVDPYMRGRMSSARSYADPVEIGGLMVGEALAEVIASRNPRFAQGDVVAGQFGWQEYAVTDGTMVRKIDRDLGPLSTALHVLGMPGLTAWVGLLEVCALGDNETVVVSGAAGAVGSTVGQIAKLKGCRAIGIAGTDEKIDWITGELGFDGGFNYKTTDDYGAALCELCPDGVDVYFDNVGGTISDAVMLQLNLRARIGICGQISQYNLERAEMGPRLLHQLIIKRARIEGFLIFDYISRFGDAMPKLARWVASGQLKYRENVAAGILSAPGAFIGMLRGANIGKQLVRIAEPRAGATSP